MQKKIIALAIAGLAAAPVFAQSNVTIYGRANLGMDNWSATGATGGSALDWKSRARVYDQGSRLGFKGTEDLGNGMKANFQIESGVNMDTGSVNGQAGTVNASAGTLASRQSYVGLQGHFGEFRLGRQEVHWTGGRINDVSANQIGTTFAIPTGGSGLVASVAARTSNVAMYVSPDFNGFNAQVGYIADGELAPAGVATNGKGWTVQTNYNNGPFALKWDYTVRTVNDTSAAGSPATGVPQNKGNKLMLGYFYSGQSHVGFTVQRNNNNKKSAATTATGAGGATITLASAGDSLAQSSWELNWEHYFGNFEAVVAYGQAGAVSGLTGALADSNQTKYKEWGLAGLYHFSKRTHMYVQYTQIVNSAQQNADNVGGNFTSATAMSSGADPRSIGVGILHNF